jgi:hypothetical protein
MVPGGDHRQAADLRNDDGVLRDRSNGQGKDRAAAPSSTTRSRRPAVLATAANSSDSSRQSWAIVHVDLNSKDGPVPVGKCFHVTTAGGVH